MTVLSVSLNEPPLSAYLSDIAVTLADEGVPLRAISRSLHQPTEVVRRALHYAQGCGKLLDLPREDWPPGTTRAERTPGAVVVEDFAQSVVDCARVFAVTRLQAHMLTVLIKRSEVTKASLHKIVEDARADKNPKEETDPKIVDVVICHLRKRLTPKNLRIETIWSFGYFMPPEDRKRAQELLKEKAV